MNEDNTFSWTEFDERRAYAVREINVSNTGTTLVQSFINRTVQQLSLREFGAQAVLDRKPGSGPAAYHNRRTPGTTGAEWTDDTTEPTEETGSYDQYTKSFKTLLGRGKVTRKMQAIGKSYGDALAEEMTGKAEDWANALEKALIIGDSGADSNSIDGLLTQIGAVSGQVVAQTSAAAGDDLTLAKLDYAIDKVKGSGIRSDLAIIGSLAGLRAVNAALQSQQQFVNMIEIAAGFRVRSYDEIPLIPSTEMPDDLVWSGTAITAFTGGSTTALAIVNRRYTFIEELTPQTVMPLAKGSSQYDQFDMFGDLALCYPNTLGGAILGGLLPST
jgi:hypothetical protein